MRYLVNRPANLFGDFDRVLNNLFDDNRSASQIRGLSGGQRNPSVDISESKEGYVLEVELPGLSEKDVDVKIEDNKLLISSISKETEDKESVKTEEPKIVIKVKRKKINYEYEKECPHCIESWDNYNTIEEWLGFNYKKYLKYIENALKAYGFEQIKEIGRAHV